MRSIACRENSNLKIICLKQRIKFTMVIFLHRPHIISVQRSDLTQNVIGTYHCSQIHDVAWVQMLDRHYSEHTHKLTDIVAVSL